MKKAISIIVLFSLLVQCVAHLGVLGYYELNKSYIARVLCINRDKPQMKCCGKCYLRKQLKKVDDHSSSSDKQPVKTEKSETVAYVVPAVIKLACSETFPVFVPQHPRIKQFQDSIFSPSIFHPPSFSC